LQIVILHKADVDDSKGIFEKEGGFFASRELLETTFRTGVFLVVWMAMRLHITEKKRG